MESVGDIVTLAADALQSPPATSSDGLVPFVELKLRLGMPFDLP